MQETIKEIEKDKEMKKLWKNYQINAIYAREIKFEDLFNPLYFITSIL